MLVKLPTVCHAWAKEGVPVPRKRRWRAAVQTHASGAVQTPPTTSAAAAAHPHQPSTAPTPVPVGDIRHVAGIVLLLALILVSTAVALRTGSNRAALDRYLAELLNQPS